MFTISKFFLFLLPSTTSTPTISPTQSPTMPVKNFVDIDLSDPSFTEGFKVLGAVENDHSGISVSGAGDVNGDGYDDVVIGVNLASPNGKPNAGTSYVLFGKASGFSDIDLASLSITQGFKVLGAVENDRSGESVSGAGDVNGDGYDDIVIGAHQAIGAAGTSYVLFGKASGFSDIDLASLSTTQGFKVLGAVGGDHSGVSVSGAGDVNGDGFDDVIIGAILASPNGKSDAGNSYVLFGKASGFSDIDLASLSTTQGFKVLGAADNDYSGGSVGGAGDINGDGYDDVVIGASTASPNGKPNAGTSYVLFGKASGFSDIDLASLSTTQGFKVIGAADNDYSGGSVSGAGDVNGDGYDDVIIGASETSYVLFGKASGFSDIDLASLSTTQGFKVLGDFTGRSVSGAGDINGDGYDDVVIGAPAADPNGKDAAGTSYVLFGKASGFSDIDLASLSTTQGFKVLGAAENDCSGISVSGAGDVNGDGYDDVVIGANQASINGKPYAGTSYIIYNHPFPPTAAPTVFSTLNPTIQPSISLSPTFTPTVASTPITENILFTALMPILSLFVSVVGGWILREKIVFHILSNWGYKYKIMSEDNQKDLQPGEIGFIVTLNKSNGIDKIICKHNDKKINAYIDNGSNNGLPEGIYNTILEQLRHLNNSENFEFLPSEKNKILCFLLSHPEFTNFSDLGYIKGNIYQKLLNTTYRQKYEDKYKFSVRTGDERSSDTKGDVENQDNLIFHGVEMNTYGESLSKDSAKTATLNNMQISHLQTATDDSCVVETNEHSNKETDFVVISNVDLSAESGFSEISGDTATGQEDSVQTKKLLLETSSNEIATGLITRAKTVMKATNNTNSIDDAGDLARATIEQEFITETAKILRTGYKALLESSNLNDDLRSDLIKQLVLGFKSNGTFVVNSGIFEVNNSFMLDDEILTEVISAAKEKLKTNEYLTTEGQVIEIRHVSTSYENPLLNDTKLLLAAKSTNNVKAMNDLINLGQDQELAIALIEASQEYGPEHIIRTIFASTTIDLRVELVVEMMGADISNFELQDL
jgi:hypothetical protein